LGFRTGLVAHCTGDKLGGHKGGSKTKNYGGGGGIISQGLSTSKSIGGEKARGGKMCIRRRQARGVVWKIKKKREGKTL